MESLDAEFPFFLLRSGGGNERRRKQRKKSEREKEFLLPFLVYKKEEEKTRVTAAALASRPAGDAARTRWLERKRLFFEEEGRWRRRGATRRKRSKSPSLPSSLPRPFLSLLLLPPLLLRFSCQAPRPPSGSREPASPSSPGPRRPRSRPRRPRLSFLPRPWRRRLRPTLGPRAPRPPKRLGFGREQTGRRRRNAPAKEEEEAVGCRRRGPFFSSKEVGARWRKRGRK